MEHDIRITAAQLYGAALWANTRQEMGAVRMKVDPDGMLLVAQGDDLTAIDRSGVIVDEKGD